MKRKLILVIMMGCFILTLVSCGNNEDRKMNVNKYKDRVKEFRSKDGITSEQKEKMKKSLFPKYKSSK
ncbi:MAG: hypothetical protein N2645_20480 [Clostridia bacterium]|nr:hypothetical protein [Clostridia bacterium]